ncbi:CLUMA_CG019221, isoform A [Clunio marinus]|uniref:CLUMA_CG019221, isoform A n=1 Tax=Clunio marinus TaxID=568069 RepID=A0A1J1J5J0_9DIPT|nr:CLUMA_CG019221, isoform A [Clunio marinus]
MFEFKLLPRTLQRPHWLSFNSYFISLVQDIEVNGSMISRSSNKVNETIGIQNGEQSSEQKETKKIYLRTPSLNGQLERSVFDFKGYEKRET